MGNPANTEQQTSTPDTARPKQAIRNEFNSRVLQLDGCYETASHSSEATIDRKDLVVEVSDPKVLKEHLDKLIDIGLTNYKTDESMGVGGGIDGELVGLAILQLINLKAERGVPIRLNHALLRSARKFMEGDKEKADILTPDRYIPRDFENGWDYAISIIKNAPGINSAGLEDRPRTK